MLRDERGSVTAEFAVAMPAVLMVPALSVGSIMLAAERAVLSSAASEVSRLEARGDVEAAAARLARAGSAVRVQREQAGALHCVTLKATPAGGLLSVVEIEARACAAVNGMKR